MSNRDINGLLESARKSGGKFSFFMPLVYYNSAKISGYEFSISFEKYKRISDSFVADVNELADFIAAHKKLGLTRTVESYINQWPNGRSLDIWGAMEETHEELAITVAHFFNFLTNSVAAVESAVNLKIANLLHSNDIDEITLKKLDVRTEIRPKVLLDWLESKSLADLPDMAAFDCFSKIVHSRNNFVHHKCKPAIFSYNDICIDGVIGDKNINIDFCENGIDSIKKIIINIDPLGNICDELTFNSEFLGYAPPSSPSPYITRIGK